ncbi:DUF6362 family protein [Mesorhizobium sp. M2A.F.Ca.ET.039.01.1.1]|uniref:DUF6362 family protein n=1 Tax=Mesorhizobium sp. M2A.F.Ca.ET.039.01.1.1 TaxID=2496746 RepID=UPI000FCAA937|nr:DUF6362 family protein [Mesorhizobium sp. M2A.F.Ca.ET.039.01.1.1]RWX72551.1 hypothetical protein EOA24_00740 [Mesorhizobium sp. M2A.F.Ca.ET.039.01.1.1]
MRERDEYEAERDSGGSFHGGLDDLWVPATVEKRLIEAARLTLTTTGPVGPKAYGSAMPMYQRDWTDWLAQLDDAFKDAADVKIEQDERPTRLAATSRQITRMEAAIRWPIKYLDAVPGPRKVLAVYLRCRAYRKPFGRACKRLGWSRATAYRARDKALALIAQGLNRDHVPTE